MLISETNDFKIFFDAFLACALWSSVDGEGEPLDSNYSIDDISKQGIETLKAQALSFFIRGSWLVEFEQSQTFEGLGHDFWLTAVGHGAGFWDGDWPKCGDFLDKLTDHYKDLEHMDLMDFIVK